MIRFWWLKAIGGPGSIRFLWTFGGLSLALLAFRRTRRIGRLLLVSLLVCYFILALPIVSLTIAGDAPASDVTAAASLGQFDDIFLLHGDNYETRAAFAASLDRTIKVRLVWVLGFKELRDAVVANGMPESRFRWETDGETTSGQIAVVRTLMEKHKSTRAIVIVSRLQAERAAALIRKEGLNVVVLAAPVDWEPAVSGVRRFVPSISALFLSRDALYERVALAYYRWKGWI